MKRDNAVGDLLKIVAMILFAIGGIQAIILILVVLSNGEEESSALLVGLVSSLISGTLFLGFSEVIFLLDTISVRINKNNSQLIKILTDKNNCENNKEFIVDSSIPKNSENLLK